MYEKSLVDYNDSMRLYINNKQNTYIHENNKYDLYILSVITMGIGIYIKSDMLLGLGILSSFYAILNSIKHKNIDLI